MVVAWEMTVNAAAGVDSRCTGTVVVVGGDKDIAGWVRLALGF